MSALESLQALAGATELNQRGKTVLAELGLPTNRLENWKYLSLRSIQSTAFAAPTAGFDGDLTAFDLDGFQAARLVWINGRFNEALSDQIAGVQINATPSDWNGVPLDRDGFCAANAAAGELLEIDVSADISLPVHCLFLSVAEPAPVAAQPRIQWQIAANAQVTVLEQHAGGAGNLVNSVQHFKVARDARVLRYKLMSASDDTNVAQTLAEVQTNAAFDNHFIDLGGKLHRDEVQVKLVEANAFGRLNGLYCVNGRNVSDSHTRIEHVVGNTQSAQHYRGIADGRGKAVFNGIVVIEKQAQKSATEQKNANLLLSDKAEINPKPELQIHADDVTASHGSTVGNLDETQLFYLRQRGIGDAEARALLTFAFADQIVEALPSKALAAAIEKRLVTALPTVGGVEDLIL